MGLESLSNQSEVSAELKVLHKLGEWDSFWNSVLYLTLNVTLLAILGQWV